MDHHIESMIQADEMETLLSFAQEHPTRVGDMLGNYRSALAQWEERDPDRIRKLLTLTWNRLDMGTRRRFIHLMLRMIYRVSKSAVSHTGQQTGDVDIAPFNFQGDEIALDQTLERLTGASALSYENIMILDRKRRKRAAVLMIDASGSMQGENLSMAAAGAASLAVNLDYRDEYSIVLFSEKAHVLKRMDQSLHLDSVLCNVLDILPEGRTNIALGLDIGLAEMQRSRVEQRLGILLTDGRQNVGSDPVPLAGRFPRLHVIGLPSGNREFAARIAKAGRGRYIALKEMSDVPGAVSACLE
ncbi:MAG: VWA domain-containing protein [Pseudomonadota bacterium]